MKTKSVPIDSIIIGDRKRELGDIADLAESISALGLLNPITVVVRDRNLGVLSPDVASRQRLIRSHFFETDILPCPCMRASLAKYRFF